MAALPTKVQNQRVFLVLRIKNARKDNGYCSHHISPLLEGYRSCTFRSVNDALCADTATACSNRLRARPPADSFVARCVVHRRDGHPVTKEQPCTPSRRSTPDRGELLRCHRRSENVSTASSPRKRPRKTASSTVAKPPRKSFAAAKESRRSRSEVASGGQARSGQEPRRRPQAPRACGQGQGARQAHGTQILEGSPAHTPAQVTCTAIAKPMAAPGRPGSMTPTGSPRSVQPSSSNARRCGASFLNGGRFSGEIEHFFGVPARGRR